MQYLFFDLECASVSKTQAKICAFGYVLTDSQFNLIEKEDILINPRGDFHLTGKSRKDGLVLPYRYEDFKKYPIFPHVYGRLKRILESPDTIVGGHATVNDANYLCLETKRYNLESFRFRFIDTQKLYMRFLMQYGESAGLERATKDMDVEFTPHKAVDDSYATMRLAKAFCERENCTLPELLERYGVEYGEVESYGYTPMTTAWERDIKAKKQAENFERKHIPPDFFYAYPRRATPEWKERFLIREGQIPYPACKDIEDSDSAHVKWRRALPGTVRDLPNEEALYEDGQQFAWSKEGIMIEKLPIDYTERMKADLGEEYADFIKTYSQPAYKGVRVNTLKITAEDFCTDAPFALSPVAWEKDGFYVNEERLGRFVEYHAGLYYSQEPSAMCAVPLLDVQPGERVLDLCAAPGGKATQIAAKMQGKGLLVCNEPIFRRQKILYQNVERLGVKNAVVTSALPEDLVKECPCFFDKILVDAPCSGEGMFKKEEEAIPNWSAENVKMCAERQRGILESAIRMLKVGGRLVYSTCTFARAEDEDQIAALIADYPQLKLLRQEKLMPHQVRGEGHFAALIEKTAPLADDSDEKIKFFKAGNVPSGYQEFEKNTLTVKLGGILQAPNGCLYQIPEESPTFKKNGSVFLRCCGLELGSVVSARFEPAHALAMALKKSECKRFVELDEKTALAYLRGETFEAEIKNGWCLVCYKNQPLGWGKAVNGTVKNHYPKGLRISHN